MILGPVSYSDCLVFCIFLTPQLLWHVGPLETLLFALRASPFLFFKLPLSFFYDNFLLEREHRSSFGQRASWFEDLVIRCVRYAFARMPTNMGRTFLSGPVALPFLCFRMLRHGYLTCPIQWKEYRDVSRPEWETASRRELTGSKRRFRGIWLAKTPSAKPDLVLYYVHGGGFSMGSSYFYLEFLMSWLSILSMTGYSNPAVFSLDYTLVPDAGFPIQVQQAVWGYEHVLSVAQDPNIVCVSGDSAGASLILSLLLHLANEQGKGQGSAFYSLPRPAAAVLISPWTTLISERHVNTGSDYLNKEQLHHYALQYVGRQFSVHDPLLSPGSCQDMAWWEKACPSNGIFITYGQDELLGQEIEHLTERLLLGGLPIEIQAEPGHIHVWPVTSMFLCSDPEKRLDGLRSMTEQVRKRIK